MEFMALHGVCKNFNAEVTKESAKSAKFNFETLCFAEDAESNDTVFVPSLLSFTI